MLANIGEKNMIYWPQKDSIIKKETFLSKGQKKKIGFLSCFSDKMPVSSNCC